MGLQHSAEKVKVLYGTNKTYDSLLHSQENVSYLVMGVHLLVATVVQETR